MAGLTQQAIELGRRMGRGPRTSSPILLQLSDIHAELGRSFDQFATRIVETVRGEVGRPDFLVVCGDFAHQGRYHERGVEFAQLVADGLDVPPTAIVCCPGNHDVETGPPATLGAYHRAVTGLLRDADRARPDRCAWLVHDDICFVTINTAFHLDFRTGRAPMRELRQMLLDLPKTEWRIAVAHHHCIPISEGDSPIAEAYPMLELLSNAGFHALLHGHRHFAMSITVGEQLKLSGVGTVAGEVQRGVANQFNLVKPGSWIARYRYAADAKGTMGIGAWQCEREAW